MADQDNDSHILLVAESEQVLGKGYAIVMQLLNADEHTRTRIRREQLISVHSGGVLAAGAAINSIYDKAERGATFNEDMLDIDESMMTSYGPPNPYAHLIQIPNECVGVLIGKGGESIKELQQKTGSKVQIARAECKEDPSKRNVFIEGSIQKFEEVKLIIEQHCKERIERCGTVREWVSLNTKDGEPRSPSDFKMDMRKDRYESNPNPGPYTYIMVQNEYTGIVIGKFGETVRKLQDKYNCQIFIPRC